MNVKYNNLYYSVPTFIYNFVKMPKQYKLFFMKTKVKNVLYDFQLLFEITFCYIQ